MSKVLYQPEADQTVKIDEQTVDFLARNGIKVDAEVNNENYLRTIFYIKCAGLKETLDKKANNAEKVAWYISSKENIDILFECMKQDAEKLKDENIFASIFSEENKDIAFAHMVASIAINNDFLYAEYKDDSIKNNEKLSHSLSATSLKSYINSFPLLHPRESEQIEDKRVQEKVANKLIEMFVRVQNKEKPTSQVEAKIQPKQSKNFDFFAKKNQKEN